MMRKSLSDPDPNFPTCRSEFMAAAVRLRQDQGLQPADIAVILKLTTNAVIELLHLADTGSEMFGAGVPSSTQPRSKP